jgi:hypothetical protein
VSVQFRAPDELKLQKETLVAIELGAGILFSVGVDKLGKRNSIYSCRDSNHYS